MEEDFEFERMPIDSFLYLSPLRAVLWYRGSPSYKRSNVLPLSYRGRQWPAIPRRSSSIRTLARVILREMSE